MLHVDGADQVLVASVSLAKLDKTVEHKYLNLHQIKLVRELNPRHAIAGVSNVGHRRKLDQN